MKTTKLLIFLATMSLFAGQAFAGPPPHGGHHHHHHGYSGSSGVRLAADIVGLVGVSLDILRGPTVVYTAPAVQPVVQPVYTTPVVQPVYTTPVYTVPAVRPVYYTTPVYTVPAPRPVYYRRPYCRPYYRY